jgi:hypothetical protein
MRPMLMTCLPTKMPILRRGGISLLARARRLVDNWVAATIARSEQQLRAAMDANWNDHVIAGFPQTPITKAVP